MARFPFILFLWGLTHASYGQVAIAHYKMDGNARDASLNANHGIILGGVTTTTDRYGNPCGALQFNGINGYIDVPHSASLATVRKPYSIAFWYRMEPFDVKNGIRNITSVCKGELSDEDLCMPQFRFQLFQFPQQSTVSINTQVTEYDHSFQQHLLPLSKWTFVAMVYDGRIIRVFLDNNWVWSFPYTGALCVNNSPLHIGRDTPGSDEFYSGAFDDLMIFNHALSEQDLLRIKQTQYTVPSATWKLQCPPNLRIPVAQGSCEAIIDFDIQTSDDTCNPITIKQMMGPTPGTYTSVGRHQAAMVSTSATGDRQTCYFTVEIVDLIPPLINCPPSIKVAATGDTVINYRNPTATDNCKLKSIMQSGGIASGNLFPLGTTMNSYIATDASGNTARCSFSIRVDKLTPSVPSAANTVIEPTEPMIQSDPPISQPFDDDVVVQHRHRINVCVVTLRMFDSAQEDNDTISFYVNGKLVVDREMIRNKRNGTIDRVVYLVPGETNELVSKAWNTGLVSPNTLTLEVYEGDISGSTRRMKRQKPILTKVLHTRPGLAGAILLTCD